MDSNHDSHKPRGMCNLHIPKRLRLPKRTRNTTSVQHRYSRTRLSGGPSTLQRSAKGRIISSQRANMETEAIAEILGGRKVRGKAIKKPDDLAQIVRACLPAGSV